MKYGVYQTLDTKFVVFMDGELPQELGYGELISAHDTMGSRMRRRGPQQRSRVPALHLRSQCVLRRALRSAAPQQGLCAGADIHKRQ